MAIPENGLRVSGLGCRLGGGLLWRWDLALSLSQTPRLPHTDNDHPAPQCLFFGDQKISICIIETQTQLQAIPGERHGVLGGRYASSRYGTSPRELDGNWQLFLAPLQDSAADTADTADTALTEEPLFRQGPKSCHADDACKQRPRPSPSFFYNHSSASLWQLGHKPGPSHLVSLWTPSLPYMARGRAGPVSNDDQPDASYRESLHHEPSGPWSPPI